MRRLTVRAESWPIAGSFRISRGSKTSAEVVLVELEQDGVVGRGECVPYARYGESIASVTAQIESLRQVVESGGDRIGLSAQLTGGAARNAIDCALWDLEAKASGRPAWALAGRDAPHPVVTAFTLSLDTTEKMAAAGRAAAARPLLKLKLAGPEDLERVRAVRASAPQSRLIVDANEGWTADDFTALSPELAGLGVELIEQPLPAGQDEALRALAHPVPVCADESCHEADSLPELAGKYDAINVKLDKTGGLTGAFALVDAAEAAGLAVMVGCMVATSLSMAPAMLVAQRARWVDLDGPLLLAQDRTPRLRYEGSLVHPPEPALWG